MRRGTQISALAGLAMAAGLTLAGLAQAGPGDKPTIQWANSWEEAVEEATARNVPIFVSFHKDG